MTVKPTLLQRAVLQRLREHGFTELADLAREHWLAGERAGARPGTDPGAYGGLLEDFDRADAQALGEPLDREGKRKRGR